MAFQYSDGGLHVFLNPSTCFPVNSQNNFRNILSTSPLWRSCLQRIAVVHSALPLREPIRQLFIGGNFSIFLSGIPYFTTGTRHYASNSCTTQICRVSIFYSFQCVCNRFIVLATLDALLTGHLANITVKAADFKTET